MESFLTTNIFLKITRAREAFKESELQQEVDLFLALIEEEYGHDADYGSIIESAQTKYEPSPVETLKSTKPGIIARIFHWMRKYELKTLQSLLDDLKKLVRWGSPRGNCRRTRLGRRDA
jgi:hypothetical protein